MFVNKISIITLTYKNWRLLEKAILSVGNQVIDAKYEVEYLVVDDGTVDFDIDYVTRLVMATGLNYRIIVNPQNLGTVASFNNAIEQSTGDIIVPLSADDEFYDDNVVNDIINEFLFTDAKIITGYKVLISKGYERDCFPRAKVINLFYNRKKLLNYLLYKGNIISGAATYYSRCIFNEIGLFDEKYRLLEDYPFYIKALSNGKDIHFFDRKVIFFGGEGVSSQKKVNNILLNDYRMLFASILEGSNLSFFSKRYFLYSKLIITNKKHVLSWLYPEQFVYFILLDFIKAVFNYIRIVIGKIKENE